MAYAVKQDRRDPADSRLPLDTWYQTSQNPPTFKSNNAKNPLTLQILGDEYRIHSSDAVAVYSPVEEGFYVLESDNANLELVCLRRFDWSAIPPEHHERLEDMLDHIRSKAESHLTPKEPMCVKHWS